MLLTELLRPAFIEKMMKDFSPGKNINVIHTQPFAIDNSASILAVLTAGVSDKIVGHFGLQVTFRSEGIEHTRHMVMKIKPDGSEITKMLQGLAVACGGNLAGIYSSFSELTGFRHTHMREIEVYQKLCGNLFPEIFGTYANHSNGLYMILMEYLENTTLLNTVMAPRQWTPTHIRQALSQIAYWHAQHLNKPVPVDMEYWSDVPSREYMLKLTPLWEALLENANCHFPELYNRSRKKMLQQAIDSIPDYWKELDTMPKTLVHNDFNPRNICFKFSNNAWQCCTYDWELATFHVPGYDAVEFLSFVLDADYYRLRLNYLDYYRQSLHSFTGMYENKQDFFRSIRLAALDFGLHRLGMYMMAHTVSPYPFLPRVIHSYFDTLQQVDS